MSPIASNAPEPYLYLSSSSFSYSDVGYEGYKAYKRGPSPIEAANFSESTRIGMLVVKRAVFQSVASMCVHAS